jgi:hypothetical protein
VTRLPLFTGSGVARALACPPSTILPQSDEDPSADTTARDAGSTVHRFIERTGELMAAHFLGHAEAARRALAEIPEGTPGRDACEALDVGALPFDLGNASIELALAYDYVTDTARVLHDANGNVIRERRYADAVPALRESEVPMTLDAVEYDGGHAIVTDVKTGQPHAGYEEQVTLGALAIARLYSLDLSMERLTGQLAYTRDLSRPVRWEITEADLEALRERIASAFENAAWLRGRAITRDDVTPGDQCRWCKARDACPTTTTAMDDSRELVTIDEPTALARFGAAIATDEGAAEWWQKLDAMETLLPRMRAALIDRAMRTPFALPDGSTVGPVTESGDRYVADVDAVHARIAAAVGTEKADAVMPIVVKRKATVGAIEKALGKPAMRQLEADGLVKRGADTTRVGVTKARAGKRVA